jgi:hypothetical protein
MIYLDPTINPLSVDAGQIFNMGYYKQSTVYTVLSPRPLNGPYPVGVSANRFAFKGRVAKDTSNDGGYRSVMWVPIQE